MTTTLTDVRGSAAKSGLHRSVRRGKCVDNRMMVRGTCLAEQNCPGNNRRNPAIRESVLLVFLSDSLFSGNQSRLSRVA